MDQYAARPNDYGPPTAEDTQYSLGDRLAAQFKDALDPQSSLSTMQVIRRQRLQAAAGEVPSMADVALSGGGIMPNLWARSDLEDRLRAAAGPDMSMEDARARIKREGLEQHVTLPKQDGIKPGVLDLLIQEGQERRDRERAIARGPQGFQAGALGFMTSLGAGMIDPINAAAFSIPVMGEARWGKILASAGDSLLARGAVNVGRGAAQGAAGAAALQPADWWLHTQDGRDYTMGDALQSVVMSAGMGAAFHAGLGAFGDIRARARGEALAGSPEDIVNQTLTAEHPARILADLPQRAQEDVVRASIADVINDQPVRASDVLEVAAAADPRIEESMAQLREAFPGAGGAPAGRSLLPFLASRGGLAPDAELDAIFGGKNPFVPGHGRLIRKTGMSLDRAREAALEGKYLFDVSDMQGGVADSGMINKLLDAMSEEFNGRRQYEAGQERGAKAEDRGQRLHDIESAMDHAFEQDGMPVPTGKIRDRVVEMLDKEGITDPLVAFERAVMEDHYAGRGEGEEAPGIPDIAGWNLPHDAGTAQGGGRAIETIGGPEGARTGAGARPIGGGNPAADRRAGAGSRAATVDRALQALKREHFPDTDLDAASKQAEAAEAPGSIEPTKAVTEAEAALKEAEQILADLKPTLSEAEMQRFTDALSAVDQDQKVRAQTIKEGAACLAAASV